MERPQEQPSSTDELAYGRPAETDEREHQAGGAGAEPGGATTEPGSGGSHGDAPMGAEGAGAPAAEAPPPAVASPQTETAPPPTSGEHGDPGPGAETATATARAPASAGHTENGGVPLLPAGDSEGFERRWQDIQVGFVDEPARCVEQADALVADVMKRLAEGFAEERRSLEGQWSAGADVSTEDLRVALQRYRSFFNRLLSTSG